MFIWNNIDFLKGAIMLLKKHTSRTFALSLALTAGMGEVILPQSLPEASAAEESVDNIYPSDTATEGSEKWGEHCS